MTMMPGVGLTPDIDKDVSSIEQAHGIMATAVCKHRVSMYENKDLRAEYGVANQLDYVEQTSWVLFRKYLHDLESERRDEAELGGIAGGGGASHHSRSS